VFGACAPQEFGRQKEQGAPFMHAIFLIMSREQSGTMSGAAASRAAGLGSEYAQLVRSSDQAGHGPEVVSYRPMSCVWAAAASAKQYFFRSKLTLPEGEGPASRSKL
jgi:hypothetical protein